VFISPFRIKRYEFCQWEYFFQKVGYRLEAFCCEKLNQVSESVLQSIVFINYFQNTSALPSEVKSY
jgi:hypothetical protein